MREVAEILKSAADTSGLTRVRFAERNAPKSISDVTVMFLLPDLRSSMIASSLLLKRYREEAKGSKYFILCSWPGFQGMFPYVDEFWSVPESSMRSLFSQSHSFLNNSSEALTFVRSLNRFFDDVVDGDVLTPYYANGLTSDFFKRFSEVKCYKPVVPSSVVLGNEFGREMNRFHGQKVFLYPSVSVQGWRRGSLSVTKIGPEFWVMLAKRLVSEGYTPVIYKGPLCHDISADMAGSSVTVTDPDISHVMAAMRSCGCVLDVFNDISRLALAARCPFLVVDERARYVGLKEYEIDDLCADGIPREYIYSFSTIITSGEPTLWGTSLIDGIVTKLSCLFRDWDRDAWPTASEQEITMPYSRVRTITEKRLGARFIKVPRM